MIKVTNRTSEYTFQNRQLADVCLRYAGGGYTAGQTAKAMLAQSEVLKSGVTKLNGFKIVMTEDKP